MNAHYQRRNRCLMMPTILLLILFSRISAFLSAPSSVSDIIRCRSTSKRNKTDNRQQYHGVSSPPSPSLSALPVPSIVGVATFYKTWPLLAGFLTASTKGAIADRLAQCRDVYTTKYDWKRNISMVRLCSISSLVLFIHVTSSYLSSFVLNKIKQALYSGTILGITCEIMYNRIFPVLFGVATAEKFNLSRVIKMTLFDGFINAPLVWLPPAYITQALVYQYPIREAIKKYMNDIKEKGLLTKYWSLWLPMTTINFAIIPSHFRILFVACISFFWMIILSIVANNDQDTASSSAVEPVPP